MPVQVISASGTQYGVIVNPDGSLNTNSTAPLPTGAGNSLIQLKYITSGTSTGVTGSQVGSIIKFIGAGSYVKVLTYTNNNLVTAGSWV